MMGFAVVAHVNYSFKCSRTYTRMMRDAGYEMLAGVNEKEARAALGFDEDEEETHGEG